MSYDCRIRMEIEAAEEAVRFFQGESQLQLVPEEEYENQQSSEEARRGDL
jgi:D-3-phosphoglycerate dehydrogenase